MKVKISVLTILASVFIFSSCQEKNKNTGEDPQPNPWDTVTQYTGILVPEEGNITFQFNYTFDGQPLEFASKTYVTAGADSITIRELRHYISNITLSRPNGEKINLKNYHLIDAKQEATRTFTLSKIPAGVYDSVIFYLGVDPEQNHSGLQEGALDPSWGMFWTWSTGYVFYRLNGNLGEAKSYSLDLGGDINLPRVSVPLSAFKVKSANPTLIMKHEVNEMFKNPQIYSLVTDGQAVHTPTDPAAFKLARNMEDMINVTQINP